MTRLGELFRVKLSRTSSSYAYAYRLEGNETSPKLEYFQVIQVIYGQHRDKGVFSDSSSKATNSTKETGYQFAFRQAGIHTLPSLADKKASDIKVQTGAVSQKKKPAPFSMICKKARQKGVKKAKCPPRKIT